MVYWLFLFINKGGKIRKCNYFVCNIIFIKILGNNDLMDCIVFIFIVIFFVINKFGWVFWLKCNKFVK